MKIINFTASIFSLTCLLLSSNVFAQNERPDFSGTWMPARGPGLTIGFPRSDWNFTEKGRAQYEAYAGEFDPDKDDPAHFCVGPGITSMAGGAPFPLEVIQRDQDITMFNEAYAQYRKIFIDGYDRPDPILPSRMGYSVGTWEGDALLVKTHMLAERTLGRVQMSGNATVEERWRIETNDEGTRLLMIDIVLSDPEIYREDIEFRGVWIDSPDTPILEYICPFELYEKHLERVRRGERD